MSSNSGAVKGDYRTNKHIPSRSCYQLIIEVPEESFPEVCRTLGYPKTGENTYVAIALLNKDVTYTNPEGAKLRTRAVLLCDDFQFQQYCAQSPDFERIVNPNPHHAKLFIYHVCKIKSRAELATNLDAQNAFTELLSKYETWKLSKTYEDNLNR